MYNVLVSKLVQKKRTYLYASCSFYFLIKKKKRPKKETQKATLSLRKDNGLDGSLNVLKSLLNPSDTILPNILNFVKVFIILFV
jgi:hypothetical protein